MKMVLDHKARLKLERLCDSLHPQEVGGSLLGEGITDQIIIRDVFPIPNISDNKNHAYKEHTWGSHWSTLYSKLINLTVLGSFHSHPDGSIPSGNDMRAYNDFQFHLWLIHHQRGEHTFQASKGIRHVELSLAPQPLKEILKPEFRENTFHLGDISINLLNGKIITSQPHLIISLLNMSEKGRRAYFTALRHIENNWTKYFDIKNVAKDLNITVPTVRRWLNEARKKKLIKLGHYPQILNLDS